MFVTALLIGNPSRDLMGTSVTSSQHRSAYPSLLSDNNGYKTMAKKNILRNQREREKESEEGNKEICLLSKS